MYEGFCWPGGLNWSECRKFCLPCWHFDDLKSRGGRESVPISGEILCGAIVIWTAISNGRDISILTVRAHLHLA